MKRPAAAAQCGAALLVAMLTVSLVALLASAAFWQQWQDVEIESAERARMQSNWIFAGARDWARAILREDAKTGAVDHLSEPWAIPMPETPLSAFHAASDAGAGETIDSSLLLQITDLQSRLNIRNLVEGGKTSAPDLRSFQKLFALLNLDSEQLTALAQQLTSASATGPSGNTSGSLLPQRMDQLIRMGLSPQTISSLKPYATLLPERSPVNINTASATVIYANLEALDLAEAQRLVDARDKSYFRSVNDAGKLLGELGAALNEGRFSVASRYFEAHSRLKLEQRLVQERVTIQREKNDVKVLWREPVISLGAQVGSGDANVLPATAR